MSIDDMMTLSEVEKVLSVTHTRVWQLLKEGKLRGKKRGNLWFIFPDSVREVAAEMERRREKKAS